MKIKNLPLIVGIALPIIFIFIISIVVFAPSYFVKPQHNFLYSNENSSSYYDSYRNTYEIVDGRLSLKLLPIQAKAIYNYKGDSPSILLYDVKSNTSHQISLEEAKNLMLDPGPSSPDGYTVSYGNEGDYGIFDLFGGSRSYNGYFVYKNNARKKLTGISSGGDYYNRNFSFIGWVK